MLLKLILILKKAKFIDSLIAINSLSLATFPLFIALPYTEKVAKLKLFIAIRESIHFAFLRIKINLSGIYEDAHTLKDWQHHMVIINTLTIILYYLINIYNLHIYLTHGRTMISSLFVAVNFGRALFLQL